MATKRGTGNSGGSRKRPASKAAGSRAKKGSSSAARRSTRSAPARRTREPLLAPQQRRDMTGLALVALGCYLGGILYVGWQGGTVGGWLEDGARL
ncbi:MAG: hypothetical protein KDC46_12120, partial [Thermoleophilia bacterium]|nr:hypothetical protein [Thermoleophilia bacterium]